MKSWKPALLAAVAIAGLGLVPTVTHAVTNDQGPCGLIDSMCEDMERSVVIVEVPTTMSHETEGWVGFDLAALDGMDLPDQAADVEIKAISFAAPIPDMLYPDGNAGQAIVYPGHAGGHLWENDDFEVTGNKLTFHDAISLPAPDSDGIWLYHPELTPSIDPDFPSGNATITFEVMTPQRTS